MKSLKRDLKSLGAFELVKINTGDLEGRAELGFMVLQGSITLGY